MERDIHLRLAGVTRLMVRGRRGPSDVFLFDPHRLAMPCWALAAGEGPPPLLITLDRHFDTVVPRNIAAIPDRTAGLHAIDEHARWHLDMRNVDHIIASMESGIIGDAIVIARSNPEGATTAPTWTDRRGQVHHILSAPGIGALSSDAERLVEAASRIILDLDLDCFTSLCDADPTEVLPWPIDVIRGFLTPHEVFWDLVLPRCIALTMALEPVHCGGIVRGNRLFEDVAKVVFEELLGAAVP